MNEEAVHGDAADAGALAPLAEHRRIAQALPWVEQVARSLAGRLGHHVPVDDLRSAGHFALMDVVRRYDPVIAPFEPYTRLRLRWAMLDEVRNNTKSRAVLARTAALDSSPTVGSATHGATTRLITAKRSDLWQPAPQRAAPARHGHGYATADRSRG